MNSEIEFKIVRGKGSYGGDGSVRSVQQVLRMNDEAERCKEIRIMHCKSMVSADVYYRLQRLLSLNLSSNSLDNIDAVASLVQLQVLDVKANRIQSLRALEKLSRLQKVDASQNIIESLQGLGPGNCQIQSLLLFQNNLRRIDELSVFKNFNKMVEICFERGSKSNPFCQNRVQYYKIIRQCLNNSRGTLRKIDDLSGQQIIQLFTQKKEPIAQERSSDQNSRSYSGNNIQSSAYFHNRKVVTATNAFNQSNNLASQKIMHLTQRQYDLQRLVDIKDEALEELRSKKAELQLTNANFYKDSLKKEVEYERVYGQVAELARNIDQKDSKINQLHKRIEELLKINASSNAADEGKSRELQKVRRELNDLKIENAELRVLSKDQEGRLRELQNKALSNIEDKSQRIEELRRKNEDVMRENYQLQKLQDDYKDRIRELTQLLKQWEFKYEQKVKQMQHFHNSEKGELIRQFELKQEEYARKHQETVKGLFAEFEAKVKALEEEYAGALESALQKYGALKQTCNEKSSSEAELKMLLKTVLSKKSEQEQTISECQEVILSSRKKINDLANESEALMRELSETRAKYQLQVKHLHEQLSKLSFERSRMEKENQDLKMSNQYLQGHFDNLNVREKQMAGLEKELQNLQSALQAKNVMLDDKNDTIEGLRLQVQNLQKELEGKVDVAEIEKVNIKYRKTKDKLKEFQERMLEVVNENKELTEKAEIYQNMEQEFTELRDIMGKQESELAEKKESVIELIQVIQKLKASLLNYQEELAMTKGEKNRLLSSLQEKEKSWVRGLRQKEKEWEERESKMLQQNGKLREVMRHFNQISNLTKGLSL